MSINDKSTKIKDFFKRNIDVDELEGILDLKVDSLFGIDNISAEKLKENKINTIQDLTNLDPQNPPQIKEILPPVLIKWIKISKILEKIVKEQLKSQKKILMIGLDNGGKTSILAVLQDKFSIIKDLLPTRGVKRERLDFFGYPILSWDMGGQEAYRDKLYFNKPGLFFGEADLVLYVIDAQDTERVEESVGYFKKILEVLSNLDEFPPILTILNKSDQDIRRTLEWQKNVESIKSKIKTVVDESMNFNVEFCDTTIFQKETIMQMFSTALIKISETSEIIENILEDFTTQIDGRALSLVSMDGLIFGSYTKTKTDEMFINNSALLLQTLSNFHNSIGLVRERVVTLELPMNKVTIRGEKLFEYSDLQIPVYLWLLSEKPEKFAEKLDFFKEQLLPLINLFI